MEIAVVGGASDLPRSPLRGFDCSVQLPCSGLAELKLSGAGRVSLRVSVSAWSGPSVLSSFPTGRSSDLRAGWSSVKMTTIFGGLGGGASMVVWLLALLLLGLG